MAVRSQEHVPTHIVDEVLQTILALARTDGANDPPARRILLRTEPVLDPDPGPCSSLARRIRQRSAGRLASVVKALMRRRISVAKPTPSP